VKKNPPVDFDKEIDEEYGPVTEPGNSLGKDPRDSGMQEQPA
jgi:hypothetical protein